MRPEKQKPVVRRDGPHSKTDQPKSNTRRAVSKADTAWKPIRPEWLRLPSGSLAVLAVLIRYAHFTTGTVVASYRYRLPQSGLARSSIQAAIADLIARRMIENAGPVTKKVRGRLLPLTAYRLLVETTVPYADGSAFIKLPHALIESPNVRPRDLRIYLALRFFVRERKGPVCHPGYRALQKATGMGSETIAASLRPPGTENPGELVRLGLVDVIHTPRGMSNMYVLETDDSQIRALL